MTNEEAIKTLKGEAWIGCQEKWFEALEMAIKALEQEPSGDLISRDAVWDVMQELWGTSGELIDRLMALPPVNPQEPCGDAISRQAVEELYYKDGYIDFHKICELPSVNLQEPKTGHWIEKDGFDGDVYYDCSECGESWTTIEGTPWDNEMNYCPNCGAKMVEPQESEDKE